MTDSLSDDLGQCRIELVEVWENERLDPAIAAKPPAGAFPNTSWSSRFLRAGERAPWVKVLRDGALWMDDVLPEEKREGENKMVLAMRDGWDFVPGEEWKIDVCGLWTAAGTDEGELLSVNPAHWLMTDGWSYTDDSWQVRTRDEQTCAAADGLEWRSNTVHRGRSDDGKATSTWVGSKADHEET